MHVGSIAITAPTGAVQEIPLHAARLCIGSAPDNDVVLTGPDIAAQHAVILCEPNGRLVLEIGAENIMGQGGMRLSFQLAQMTRQRDLAWIGEYVISYLPPRWNCRTQPIDRSGLPEAVMGQTKTAPTPCHSADDTLLLQALLRQTFLWQPAGEAEHEAATQAMPMMFLSAAAE